MVLKVTVALLFALTVPFTVSAQTATSSQGVTQKAVTVATVNIQNAVITGQKDNLISLGFDISNREGVQPEVIYAVNLLKKESDGQYSLVDKRIYHNDILNLGIGQTIHKELDYQAQTFLSGIYKIGLEARNADGLPFSVTQISEEVTLNGSGEYIGIDSNSCFLTVEGESGNKKYTLVQGVDIAPTETLIVHCTIKNGFKKTISITPFFQTYYRTAFGKILGEEKADKITLNSGETRTYAVAIPKETLEPQAYEAGLSFLNDQGAPISQTLYMHYVLRGESATIQNINLDKDYYAKGDIANASLYWTGSADTFPDARGPVTQPGERNLSVDISNDKGVLCISQFTKKLVASGGLVKIEVPVIADCENPTISVSITDTDGKVIAQKDFSIQSTNIPAQNQLLLIFSTVFSLLAIGFIIYIIRKRRATSTLLLFFILVTAGVLMGGQVAKADTYSVGDYGATVVLSPNPGSTYDPGATISASALAYYPGCNNEGYKIAVSVVINGQGATLIYMGTGGLGSADFTAPSIPGDYIAAFTIETQVWWYPYDTVYTLIDVPYTVTAPPAASCSYNNPFYWPNNSTGPCQGSYGSGSSGTVSSGDSVSVSDPAGDGYSGSLACSCSDGAWSCSDLTCTPDPTPVNGACSVPLSHYNCSSGTLPWAGADYADRYEWWCYGSNGGTNVMCTEPKIAGVCSTTHYNCTVGTLPWAGADYADRYEWWCKSPNAGTNGSTPPYDVLCTEMKSANGACYVFSETDDNQFSMQIPSYASVPPSGELCSAGTASDNSVAAVWNLSQGAYADGWTWRCNGSNGGASHNCSVLKTPATWTNYCTGGSDPNGNNWQIWAYDNSNPVNYKFVENGTVANGCAASSAPTASLTVYKGPYNSATVGVHDITLTVGDQNTKVWSSTGGTSWSSTYSYDNGTCTNAGLTGAWGATTAGGSVTSNSQASNAGCTATVTYTVVGPGGSASDSIHVTTVATPAPDLTAGAVTPTSATVGVETILSAQISNSVTSSTGAGFTDLFEINPNNIPASFADIQSLRKFSSGALAAGGSNTATASYTFPTTGTWYVRACADLDETNTGVITESNEDNNCGSEWTEIIVGSAPVYACTSLPANASAYPAPDNTDLTANTPYTFSSTDTPAKCQFKCTTGYSWNGSSCVSDPPPTPDPSCSVLEVDPTDINTGGTVALTWVCEDASSCNALTNSDGFSTGGSLSGTDSSVNPSVESGQVTYGLTCDGTNFYFPPVTVHSPDADIWASSLRVDKGSTSTIFWSSNNVLSCTITRGGTFWDDDLNNSTGKDSIIDGPTTFTITCPVDVGPPKTDSVTVDIKITDFGEF